MPSPDFPDHIDSSDDLDRAFDGIWTNDPGNYDLDRFKRQSDRVSVIVRRYRVLATVLSMRPLPLKSVSHFYYTGRRMPVHEDEELILREAQRITRAYGLKNRDAKSVWSDRLWSAPPAIDIVSRSIKNQPRKLIWTILIHADWYDGLSDSTWSKVAREGWELVDNYPLVKYADRRFDVEIIATQITTPIWTASLLRRDSWFLPWWEYLSLQVAGFLEANPVTRGRWRFIHPYRLLKQRRNVGICSRIKIYIEVEDDFVQPA